MCCFLCCTHQWNLQTELLREIYVYPGACPVILVPFSCLVFSYNYRDTQTSTVDWYRGSLCVDLYSMVTTVHGKILVGRKLTNLVNCKLFTKIFLANIHRYTKNVFGICTDCSLFAKCFHTNSFYLYGSPKFSPAKTFLVYSMCSYLVYQGLVGCLHCTITYKEDVKYVHVKYTHTMWDSGLQNLWSDKPVHFFHRKCTIAAAYNLSVHQRFILLWENLQALHVDLCNL